MIHIVDYKAGNLTSVKRALDHLGITSCISADGEVIRNADRIIFPGVGHAASAMATLVERGLDAALTAAFTRGTPILGICLGTQIILGHSREGDTSCLELIPGEVLRFNLQDPTLKIPHMGWNAVNVCRDHPLLRSVEPGDEFYFVHSYYPQPTDPATVYATCEYEITFAAAIGLRNLFATQFHPEKSGRLGLAILEAFARWDGTSC